MTGERVGVDRGEILRLAESYTDLVVAGSRGALVMSIRTCKARS